MKRVFAILVPAAMSGCVTLPLSWQQPPAQPPAPAKPTVVAPVTPEEVNADNVREKAAALDAELERESRQPVGEVATPAASARPQSQRR